MKFKGGPIKELRVYKKQNITDANYKTTEIEVLVGLIMSIRFNTGENI